MQIQIERKSPDFRLVIIGLIILMVGTFFFRWDNGVFDLTITEHFYKAELPAGDRFFLAKAQPWLWFKQNDATFAVVLTLSLLVLLGLSFKNEKFRPLRRYALFGLTSVIVGPGLLVNVIFKGYWGRPRPTQTQLWPDSATPDNLPFYKVWDPAFLDGMDKNAFPCGHASIVIVYIVLFYIFKNPGTLAWLLGEYKSKILTRLFTGFKYLGLTVAFVGGGLMGFTRIVQGAHFASDVLWSFGMVFLVNWGLYYFVFKLHRWEVNQAMDLFLEPEVISGLLEELDEEMVAKLKSNKKNDSPNSSQDDFHF